MNCRLKVNCRKQFRLVCHLLAEPAQIFSYNSLSVYNAGNSLSIAIHLYMIRAYKRQLFLAMAKVRHLKILPSFWNPIRKYLKFKSLKTTLHTLQKRRSFLVLFSFFDSVHWFENFSICLTTTFRSLRVFKPFVGEIVANRVRNLAIIASFF